MKCSFSEQEKILYLLKGLSNQISPKFERCTGISSSRYELLHHLYEVDEVNQSTLQKVVNIDSAAITRHLKQLEADGMVVRNKIPSDNRVTLVRLTEDGRKRIIATKIEQATFVNQMLQDFSKEEIDVLANMIQRMQNNISEF
ncbi:DNA-binding MarR family transcriptional regulator [Paenibacillus anaericanus]|uniref:MarR family winged helix-turn-helix transcriptional regulator n=1 Tax=Paenibacillus anaericanus TaxID=170367 RepID=UPI002780EF41|nr:MarR family transcriptional regulator [Paenibacillus anaericanus]MDQ0091032.1 DNA-binding MarR family transcriptional regulator [Paenibacillus anaericanus]